MAPALSPDTPNLMPGYFATTASAMLIALLLDAVIGWPAVLFDRIGHPVTWLGRVIGMLDARFNREVDPPVTRRVLGLASALGVIGTAAGLAALPHALVPDGATSVMVCGVLAWPLVATRSLFAHVHKVAAPLEANDIPAARQAVSQIVGRDTSSLDRPGIARAAIESLAENASDGIVAPVFWGTVLGLPGIAAYKAINTLDSMIGHKSPRYLAFGWAAARIDDGANLLPARLTAVLMALASPSPRRALATAFADAGHHRSPNAGWPEAAMAGALDVRLSGPRAYHGQVSNEPWLNAGGREAGPADIERALAIYMRAMSALVLLLVAIALTALEL